MVNATNGMTAAFSKNSRPPKYTSRPVTAYRWLPVRTSRIASAHTHASAASIGSEFSAAAHHANAGTASGVNSANVNGTSSTGRQPRITCSARSSASDASSCKHHQADRRPDPVQRREPGDAARDQERPGHDVAVVVVEQIVRRQQALGARPADQDQVVPVEVAAERQHRPDDQLHRDQRGGGAGDPVHRPAEPTVRRHADSGPRYGEPMRTLVTGAAGFIGSTLVDRLLADGHTSSASTTSARDAARTSGRPNATTTSSSPRPTSSTPT